MITVFQYTTHVLPLNLAFQCCLCIPWNTHLHKTHIRTRYIKNRTQNASITYHVIFNFLYQI